MFAPITMGMASDRLITWAATAATKMEVTVELLCKRAVESNPMNNPINGFSMALNIIEEVSPDIAPMEEPIILIDNRKTNTPNVMAMPLYKPV